MNSLSQSDRINYLFTYLDQLIKFYEYEVEWDCDNLIQTIMNEINRELRIPNAK